MGIGAPIPILSEEVLKYTLVKDADITAPIVDYSDSYPNRKADILGEVSYAQLKTGKIKIGDKEVVVGSLSSYSKAIEIANTLKKWIREGEFLLTEPVSSIPGVESNIVFKNINFRPIHCKTHLIVKKSMYFDCQLLVKVSPIYVSYWY